MKLLDFSKYSSIKIGPTVKIKIIDKIKKENENYAIIGGANNLLVSPNPPKLAKLSKSFDYIYQKDNLLYIGGATPSGKILSYVKKNDIAHFEIMQKLPGLLGGIVKMNAGLKEYEIFNHLLYIKTINNYIKKDDIQFSYRYTNIKNIIYEAVFKIEKGFNYKLFRHFENLRINQPNLPSAGSCFKNPKGYYAGEIIEDCGLKGYQKGNAAFSKQHANFLVNLGNAKFQDALDLIELAENKAFEKFKIKLEKEIIIL